MWSLKINESMNILFAGSSNESGYKVRDSLPEVLQILHTPHAGGHAKHTNCRSHRPFLHRLLNCINEKRERVWIITFCRKNYSRC